MGGFGLTLVQIKLFVQSGIPGSGKTKEVREFCKAHPELKIAVLSPNHELLTEYEQYLTNFRHWKGISKKCPLRDTDHRIKTLIEGGVSARYICAICGKLKINPSTQCPYKQQFRKLPNLILAPIDYVFTKQLRNFRPDYIYVDDVSQKKQDLPTPRGLKKHIKTLKRAGILGRGTTLDDILAYPKLYVREIYQGIRFRIKTPIFQQKPHLFSNWFVPDPRSILEFVRLANLHKEVKPYSIPSLFPLFELAERAKVFLVEAHPNKMNLEKTANRYYFEQKKLVHFDWLPPKTLRIPEESKVYRVGYAWYPQESLHSRKVRRNIHKLMDAIIDRLGTPRNQLTIGIISYKAVVGKFTPQKVKETKRLHFGALAGLNVLEDVDVLFVIGTYNVNLESIPRDFELFYAHPPKTLESVSINTNGRGPYRYLDPELENFHMMLGPYQMYQSAHRGRPGLRPIDTYFFGVVPYWLKQEFQVWNIRDIAKGIYSQKDLESYIREEILDRKQILKRDLVKLILDSGLAPWNSTDHVYRWLKNFCNRYGDEFEAYIKQPTGRGRPLEGIKAK